MPPRFKYCKLGRCSGHQSKAPTICTGIKRSGLLCTHKATLISPDHLPTCRLHIDQQKRAGSCQAIEDCGQVCGRPCAYAPPLLELCSKHENGSPTIPCYLLSLPVELRMNIFWYLFPDEIPAEGRTYQKWHKNKNLHDGILKANRQINMEAETVLYEQIPFQVIVDDNTISLCGRAYARFVTASDHRIRNVLNNLYDPFPPIFRRIRALHVEVQIHRSRLAGADYGVDGIGEEYGISEEECELYRLRSNMRRLANACSGHSLHQLVVSPQIEIENDLDWTSEENLSTVVFVVTPLKAIQNIRKPKLELVAFVEGADTIDAPKTMSEDEAYSEYQRKFEFELRGGDTGTASGPMDMDTELSRFEKFASLLGEPARDPLYRGSTYDSWKTTIFSGIESVAHYARFLRENGEWTNFPSIQAAVERRWKEYLDSQRRLESTMDNGVQYLLGKMDESELESRQDFKPFRMDLSSRRDDYSAWSELDFDTIFSLPFQGENQEKVKKWEDTERLYFEYNGEVKFRLKTPQLLRETRDL